MIEAGISKLVSLDKAVVLTIVGDLSLAVSEAIFFLEFDFDEFVTIDVIGNHARCVLKVRISESLGLSVSNDFNRISF